MTRRAYGGTVAAALIALCAGCRGAEQTPDMTGAQAPEAPRADLAITTDIQSKYYQDDLIRGRSIDVRTENGVVTLSGTLPDQNAEAKALALARGVQGVQRVDDQLEVAAGTPADQPGRSPTGTAGRTGGAVEPGWITTKIQAQYFISPEIKPWNIDVTTASDGVVTLSGQVDAADDKAEAVRIARETEGVTRVDDRLRVKGEPGVQPGETPAAGLEKVRTLDQAGRDSWITTKVQAKFFMDSQIKGHQIDVDTRKGVVTLKGVVSSEAAKKEAARIASETDGVSRVLNELKVAAG
jgi:osmotically-inducible protein OsmY